MTFAVLSPHLDDAVLSCWGVLESPEAGSVVNVFTASPARGSAVPAWDRLTGATDSRVRMDERRREDRRALATVGRTTTDLDRLDGQCIAEEIGRDVDSLPVETDGARRAAVSIAELLG